MPLRTPNRIQMNEVRANEYAVCTRKPFRFAQLAERPSHHDVSETEQTFDLKR